MKTVKQQIENWKDLKQKKASVSLISGSARFNKDREKSSNESCTME